MGALQTNVLTIEGVECYEQDGVAYLKLETVARGLGFTRIADSGNEVVRWERVEKYLSELGVPTCGHDDFIPENVFYRLAMKAKNAAAEQFQAKIADEVIPSIRKHGAYMTPEVIEQTILNPDFIINLAQKLKEEMEARKAAERTMRQMALEQALQQPKIDYFDALVEKNMLTGLRETAKLLGTPERAFIRYLIQNRYLFRSRRGNLLPYATRPHNELFTVKEWFDEKSGKGGVQTFVTPRGRETLRLLLAGKPVSGLWGRKPSALPAAMTAEQRKSVEDFYENGRYKKES